MRIETIVLSEKNRVFFIFFIFFAQNIHLFKEFHKYMHTSYKRNGVANVYKRIYS
jgi:hypothetical protein